MLSVFAFIFEEIKVFALFCFIKLIRFFKIQISLNPPEYIYHRSLLTKGWYYSTLMNSLCPPYPESTYLKIQGWGLASNGRKILRPHFFIDDQPVQVEIRHVLRLDLLRMKKSIFGLFCGFEALFEKEHVVNFDKMTVKFFSNGEEIAKTNLHSVKVFGLNEIKSKNQNTVAFLDHFHFFKTKDIPDDKNLIFKIEISAQVVKKFFFEKRTNVLNDLNRRIEDDEDPQYKMIFKKIPIQHTRQLSKEEIIHIKDESFFEFESPSYFPQIKKRKISSYVPAEQIYIKKNVQLLRANIVLTQKNEYFLWDISANPTEKMTAGHWPYILKDKEESDKVFVFCEYKEKRELKKGILINGRCTSNYYHWMVEYLPRFLEIKNRSDYKDYPILIEQNLPSTIIESLKLLAEGHPIQEIDQDCVYSIEELIIPSMLTFQPDDTDYAFEEISGFRLDKLKELREFFLKHKTARNFPKKIYVGRKNQARSILNDFEVRALLDSQGFVSIDTMELSFREQVQLFNEAEHVVLLAGAATVNTMFCEPSCKVTCFVAARNGRHYAHKIMSDVSEAQFTYILGDDPKIKALYKNEYDYTHANFSLNPAILKRYFQGPTP